MCTSFWMLHRSWFCLVINPTQRKIIHAVSISDPTDNFRMTLKWFHISLSNKFRQQFQIKKEHRGTLETFPLLPCARNINISRVTNTHIKTWDVFHSNTHTFTQHFDYLKATRLYFSNYMVPLYLSCSFFYLSPPLLWCVLLFNVVKYQLFAIGNVILRSWK